uniref:zinc finger FYVE domain-containing protein 1-like n=1 Tax=Callithrix jacchus TaxID=9483 RepID=UPI00159F6099|nr:zinc finger FYVE domain-containing protein 1-like [Callithrix jacchus]
MAHSSFFPDEYFTCSSLCLSCGVGCKNSMNHGKEGVPHEAQNRCRYSHQYDNRIYTCKACYERGDEVSVVPKTSTSTDSPWMGLAKYAWSGYVIECPNCGGVYHSRQYWFGNKDPVDKVVRTEIVHVWPGVRTVFLYLVLFSFSYVENRNLLKIKVNCEFQNIGGLERHDLESFFAF